MRMTICILMILTLLTFKIQAQNDSTIGRESTDKMNNKLINDFQNRPIYNKLTQEILDSISDDKIEQAIVDNMHTKMNEKLINEVSVLKNSTIGRQAIYTTWWIEAEINNGGFNQYFYNSGDKYLPYLINGLIEMDDKDYLNLFQRAIVIYNDQIKKQHDSQDGSIQDFLDSYDNNPLSNLDDEFYKLDEVKPLRGIRIKYIRQNIDQFTED